MMGRLLTFGFGQPWWLLLLALVPLLAWLRGRRGGEVAALQYSALGILKDIGAGVKARRGSWLASLQLLALALLIIAMARPRMERGDSSDRREGVDIVFAVDVSGSMDTKDFIHQGQPISRREALVMAIGDFVDHRPNDRFGMIGFAGQTYLMSPMTMDGEWIKNVLLEIQTQGGTAIGDGIVGAVQLLKDVKGKSKIIIAVTDGENNAGIAPLTAAELAAKDKIRVHTVIINKQTNWGDVSKHLMAQVAERTGGQFFRVTNLSSIMDVYRQIDRMEKSEFEQRRYRVYEELYPWFALPAFVLLLAALIMRNTLWMRLP